MSISTQLSDTLMDGWRHLSSVTHDEISFAFILHPRDLEDVYRKFPFLKRFPQNISLSVIDSLWPIRVSEIRGLKSQTDGKPEVGAVIAVPMTAEQLLNNREKASHRIVQAAQLAYKLGAKIVGLGALSSSLSRGGRDVAEKVPLKLTSGHAFTAFNITNYYHQIKSDLNEGDKPIAIVGAAGSIGTSCAQVLCHDGIDNLYLIDLERKRDELETLKLRLEEINKRGEYIIELVEGSLDYTSINKCHWIIAATNAPAALIKNKHLKSGAIIIDDAQPSDIHPEVLNNPDVIAVEAGAVHTPGIETGFDFGLINPDDSYSCMAEVLIRVAFQEYDYSIYDRPDISEIKRIGSLGKELGFSNAQLQNFAGTITQDRIEHIRQVRS